MSIAHRPFSAGFGRNSHTTRTPNARPWGWGHAEEAESESPAEEGRITSYPWEGLYLAGDETTASACPDAPQPSTQLGLFLNSLMYGE